MPKNGVFYKKIIKLPSAGWSAFRPRWPPEAGDLSPRPRNWSYFFWLSAW